jgi:hypothetical protein
MIPLTEMRNAFFMSPPPKRSTHVYKLDRVLRISAIALTLAATPAASSDRALARYQPFILFEGTPVAVDTGGDTAIERSAKAFLTQSHTLWLLGRGARALIAPDGYLAHWYMSKAIVVSAGPTWLAEGPVIFDFAGGTVRVGSLSRATAIDAFVNRSYPFVAMRFDNDRHVCLFDTGSVGRLSATALRSLGGPELQAVNTLDARTFDRLAGAHPGWVVPQATAAIPEDKGTDDAALLVVPAVTSATAVYRNVLFVRRRQTRTFDELTAQTGTRVDCDAGGALFRKSLVELDLQKGKLWVSQ